MKRNARTVLSVLAFFGKHCYYSQSVEIGRQRCQACLQGGVTVNRNEIFSERIDDFVRD